MTIRSEVREDVEGRILRMSNKVSVGTVISRHLEFDVDDDILTLQEFMNLFITCAVGACADCSLPVGYCLI